MLAQNKSASQQVAVCTSQFLWALFVCTSQFLWALFVCTQHILLCLCAVPIKSPECSAAVRVANFLPSQDKKRAKVFKTFESNVGDSVPCPGARSGWGQGSETKMLEQRFPCATLCGAQNGQGFLFVCLFATGSKSYK